MSTQPTAADRATESLDAAAHRYGTDTAKTLVGRRESDPYTVADLFQESTRDLNPYELQPLNGREVIPYDEGALPHSPEALSPEERQTRVQEHTRHNAELANEVARELERRQRLETNKPLLDAYSTVMERRAAQATTRAQAEAAAAEQDRLARLAGQAIPSSPKQYEALANAAFQKYHSDLADVPADTIRDTAVQVIDKFREENGTNPTPRALAALVARELAPRDEDPDRARRDREMLAQIDSLDIGPEPERRGPKVEAQGTDMFVELRRIQSKMGLY